ncbi:MAG: hypothetical protein LPH21_15970 [Shewanella sp.]|nr:hypothetical protein [Shewanella sp.]
MNLPVRIGKIFPILAERAARNPGITRMNLPVRFVPIGTILTKKIRKPGDLMILPLKQQVLEIEEATVLLFQPKDEFILALGCANLHNSRRYFIDFPLFKPRAWLQWPLRGVLSRFLAVFMLK